MAEISANPRLSTRVTTVEGYDIHTLTAAGASYVEKKIHPPAPVPSDYCGRPCVTSQEIVLFQTPGETDIRPIFTYLPGVTPGESPKNIYCDTMLFLSVPGGNVSNYAFYKVGDNAFAQQGRYGLPDSLPTQPPACTNSGYDWTRNYPTDISEHYVDYQSSTYYANVTDFNNQGLISTSIFKPDIIYDTLPLLYEKLKPQSRINLMRAINPTLPKSQQNDFASFDKKHRHRHDSDDDEFVVMSKGDDSIKLPSFRYSIQLLSFGTNSATIDYYGPMPVLVGLLPRNIGEIQSMSRNNATRPFKEGAFVVSRDSEEVQLFTPRTINNSGGMASCMIHWYNPTLAVDFYYLLHGKSVASTEPVTNATFDIPWSSTTMAMTMIQGMTVPGPDATGVTLASLPYISVKSITGHAIQPAPRSSLNVFMTELPAPDRAAIDLIACINRSRPDSLPASANDFGSIAAGILSLAPSVIGLIKDLFGSKKSDKPVAKKAKAKKEVAVVQKEAKKVEKIAKKMDKMDLKHKPKPKPKPRQQNVWYNSKHKR